MKRLAAMLSIATAISLAGCSAFEPYPTYPRLPEATKHDAGPRVAICYDPLMSSAAAFKKAAQSQCTADSVATRIDTDFLLQYCPLLLPGRATFVCVPTRKK
jgi:hypothetical protein